MAFAQLVPAEEAGLIVDDKTTVLPAAREASFASLGSAIARLVELLSSMEDKKLAAARVVQAIDRQQLYREAGCETMADFYPLLLQQTAAVGWQAERTVKMWLAFANLYLDTLELPEAKAMKANSHLHALYVLADVDRKTGELKDEVKTGKLEADDFQAVVAVVTALVTATSVEQKLGGLDAAATRALLLAADVRARDVDTFVRLSGNSAEVYPQVPVNGWTVADTKLFIEAVRGKQEVVKARRVWYLSFKDAERVEVERLAFEVEGEEIDSIDRHKTYPLATFEAMAGGDKVVDNTVGDGDDDSDDDFTSEED